MDKVRRLIPAIVVGVTTFSIVDVNGNLLVLLDGAGQPIQAFAANGTPLPNTMPAVQ